MNLTQKGLETLKTGGYVVFIVPSEDGASFVGLWSNPTNDEYEINRGPLVRRQPIRTDGDTQKYQYHSELLKEYFTYTQKSKPNLIYSYTPNTAEELPEGFKEVTYLIPHQGNFKAVSDTGELLSLIPVSSAMHLFVKCGIPYTSGFMGPFLFNTVCS